MGATVACPHRDDAIQECVRRVGGRESWRRSKIVERRIDRVAARDRRYHLRRPVTQAERLHRDQRTIMRLKCDAEVELENAICAKE